ncbi:MAG TPA: GNAT family N-acetyltransferase [Gemmatimonadales bacterium]|nr:GNAT family N-acetyltransferase [Gemmatimonadales bacterium]
MSRSSGPPADALPADEPAPAPPPPPAYRVVTPRLVLRCWDPADAPALAEAVTASLDALRPWMNFVQSEPEPLEAKIARLRRFRAAFDRDEDFAYGVFPRDGEVRPAAVPVWGGTALHPRIGPGGLEIGYWLHTARHGKGYATELSAALTRVAFAVHGAERVEIRCEPANAASAAVPRRLGFRHEATLARRHVAPDGKLHDLMVWTLWSHEFAASPAADVPVEAFDAAGRPLATAVRSQ